MSIVVIAVGAWQDNCPKGGYSSLISFEQNLLKKKFHFNKQVNEFEQINSVGLVFRNLNGECLVYRI